MTIQQTKQIRAEVKLPIILIHTAWGLKFFDKVAKTEAARKYAKVSAYLMPMLTVVAMALIISQLVTIASDSFARQSVKAAGIQSNILIPGLNPYLPIAYGWGALIVALIIHESAHGITARVLGYRVESTGIVLFLGIPIGAFVNIPQEEANRATLRHKMSIMTAGVLVNGIVAIGCLLSLYAITSSLTPIAQSGPQYGVPVGSTYSGSLAEQINITKDSIIQNVGGTEVHSTDELGNALTQNLGKTINITWLEPIGNSQYKQVSGTVTLPATAVAGKPILGVKVYNLPSDPTIVLNNYQTAFTRNPLAILLPPTVQQTKVPFSDYMAGKYISPLGANWSIVANTIFWFWFINFNLAIFNALPIYGLDGGQLYKSILDHRFKKTVSRNVNVAVSAIVAGIIVMLVVIPYVAR